MADATGGDICFWCGNRLRPEHASAAGAHWAEFDALKALVARLREAVRRHDPADPVLAEGAAPLPGTPG